MNNTTHEILFRGKRVDNGEWVKGIPVKTEVDFGIKMFIITHAKWDSDDNSIDFLETEVYEIAPSTVCRFTGLTDKNGVKIFEGDIIKSDEYKFIVKFGECGGVQNVGEDVGYIGFYVEPVGKDSKYFLRTDILYWVNAYESEVVGNIHDGVKKDD